MTAATLISYTASTWDIQAISDTKMISGIAVNAGDVLVASFASEEYDVAKLGDVTSSGGETWTEQTGVKVSGNCSVGAYTTTVISTGSIDVTAHLIDASDDKWGFAVYVFRGSSGVGASASTTGTGAPSLPFTTTGANSSVAIIIADWNAVDGASRAWRSGATDKGYFRNAAAYTVYSGAVIDSSTAGAKTEGLTAPTGQKYSIAAVEVLAGGGGGSAPVANAGVDQADIESLSTVTLQGSGTNSPTSFAWTQTAGVAVTLSSNTVASPTFTAPADANGTTLTFSLVASNASGSSSPDTVNVVVLPHLEWGLNGSGAWRPSKRTLIT